MSEQYSRGRVIMDKSLFQLKPISEILIDNRLGSFNQFVSEPAFEETFRAQTSDLGITEKTEPDSSDLYAKIREFLTTQRARISLDEAKQLVEQNSGVADFSGLSRLAINTEDIRTKASELGITEEDLFRRLVAGNIEACVEPLLNHARALPIDNPLRQVIDQMDLEMEEAESFTDFHVALNGFGEINALTAPESAYGRVIEMLLSENATRREILKIIDAQTEASTSRNLRKIDQANFDKERVLKDVVIVGGGPLTAIAVAILSPFRNVTVITAEDRLGGPMRSRPIHLNSSVDEDDPLGAQLPLASGSTTPVNPRGMLNQPRVEALLDETVLAIKCDAGDERRYISAQRLGEGTAAAIIMNTADIITGQEVEGMEYDEGKDRELVLRDQLTGKERKLKAKTVLVLGGPGKETSVFEDQASKDLYEESEIIVDLQIESLKVAVENGMVEGFRFDLPPVLTLTTISRLLSAWDSYLGRDPQKYPLNDLLNSETRAAVLGDADTGRTMVELLTGKAPVESYSDDFVAAGNTPSITWYNQAYLNPREYKKGVRRRYGGVWTDNEDITPVALKANGIEKVNTADPDKALVAVTDADGNREMFDYVIAATGFKRKGNDSSFVLDGEGNTVGRGGRGVYYGGSYADLRKADFPPELQNIIDGLGIPENTISMWVNAVLLQRLVWTIAGTERPSEEQLKQVKV